MKGKSCLTNLISFYDEIVSSYWSVGNQFSMWMSTIGVLLMEVVRAINSILLRRVIHLGDLDPIVIGFAALGFPNCAGAIDGTHIPIRAPEHRVAQHINRKGYFSMVLQALVDHRGRFTDIFVGWLGRADNAHIFWNSSLYGKLEEGTFFPAVTLSLGICRCHCALWGTQPKP
nr:protein ALP1-like [Pelodiscus sinensis]|eukprot:XP_025037961.1 protein ALP1-like [Pelodiscus sinensis]